MRSDGSITSWTMCAQSPSRSRAAWLRGRRGPGAFWRAHALWQRDPGRTAGGRRVWCWPARRQRPPAGGTRAKLQEIEANPPAGVTLRPFYDRGALVERAVARSPRSWPRRLHWCWCCCCRSFGNLRAALVVALILPPSALATLC